MAFLAGLEPAFVGRTDELAVMQERLRSAIDGQGSVVLLAGEPGIGKTRLADETAAMARASGVQVLWGRCYEGEGAPAFWPWTQVLRTVMAGRDPVEVRALLGADVAHLAPLIPDFGDPDGPATPAPAQSAEARFRLFAAVAALVTAAATTAPLLVMLDDLHWADTPSLLLFEFLAREAGSARMLLAGTYRDTEVADDHPLSRTLGRLARLPTSTRLQLRGLDADDVASLIGGIVGSPPSATRSAAVSDATEGNPFFVSELVRFQASSADAAEASSLVLPPSLRGVIGLRVADLSPACSHLLTLAAVIGREFPLRALAHVSEGAGEHTLEALEEAEAARLIAPAAAPGSYRFAHALIRESLYEGIPGLRRIRLHRQVGEALAQLWGDDVDHAAALAWHFFQAASANDGARALGYAHRAADQARRQLAYEESVRYYDMALQALESATPADQGRRFELLLCLAEAQNAAGDEAAGKDTVERAIDVALDIGEPGELVRAFFTYEQRLGLGTEDLRWTEPPAATGWAGPQEDAARQVRHYATLARALTFVNAERSAQLGRQAVALARRSGDAATLAFALAIHMTALTAPGEPVERLALATEIVATAGQTGNVGLQLQGQELLALALVESGDLAAADMAVAEMCRIGEANHHPHHEWRRLAWAGVRAVLEGRFVDGEQAIFAAFAAGQRSGVPGVAERFAMQLYSVRHEQGRLAELVDALKGMIAQFPLPSWRSGLALACVHLDRIDDARREFETLAIRDFAGLPRDLFWPGTIVLLANVCAALDDRPRAAVLYDLLLPYRGRIVAMNLAVNACTGCSSRELGLLATTLGRWSQAAEHFEEALLMNAAMRARPRVAATQLDYARMRFLQSDERDSPGPTVTATRLRHQAHALLAEARATAAELGMARLLVQIDRLQQEQGTEPAT